MSNELEKLKNDPTRFMEKFLGMELSFWQKHYLKMYPFITNKYKRRRYK